MIIIDTLYKFSIQKFVENYEDGDSYMLEYLKRFIPSSLEKLYGDVRNYNEILYNGYTLNDLLIMGKTNKYWNDRVKNFIKKYKVKRKDYNNYSKYYNDYLKLRKELLDKMSLLDYING